MVKKKLDGSEQRVLCVDLDGTILKYTDGWQGVSVFGKPVRGVKKFLRRLKKDGWFIIIYTCRKDKDKIA